jgi:hypothetical protein
VEVVAVLSTVLIHGAALSFAARGGAGAAERFVFPYVLVLLPYAAYQLVTSTGPWILRRLRVGERVGARLAWVVPAVLCAGQLGLFAGGLASDPRGHMRIPPEWAETSEWLSRNLRKGEKFAFPYHSLFSTFDRPFPDPDGRWSYPFTTEVALMTRQMAEAKLRLALIDTEDQDYPKYRHRLSGADEHGPLAFLGWPRCFHDRRRPSRFLIYCRPDRQAAAVGHTAASHGLSTERTLR